MNYGASVTSPEIITGSQVLPGFVRAFDTGRLMGDPKYPCWNS